MIVANCPTDDQIRLLLASEHKEYSNHGVAYRLLKRQRGSDLNDPTCWFDIQVRPTGWRTVKTIFSVLMWVNSDGELTSVNVGHKSEKAGKLGRTSQWALIPPGWAGSPRLTRFPGTLQVTNNGPTWGDQLAGRDKGIAYSLPIEKQHVMKRGTNSPSFGPLLHYLGDHASFYSLLHLS